MIREEADELWDEVKADTAYTMAGMNEAIQTAAMAVRFVVDLHDHPKATTDRLDLPGVSKAALLSMFQLQHPLPHRTELMDG